VPLLFAVWYPTVVVASSSIRVVHNGWHVCGGGCCLAKRLSPPLEQRNESFDVSWW
jgi:hypothetical protein